jgi:hypothetical protein
MSRYLTVIFVLLFTVIHHGQDFSNNQKQEILKVLENQRLAWNSGDIEGYMMGYWNSDSLRFIGKNGITFGWKETLARYRKGYPTRERMGILTFEIISLEKLTENTALMIGKWSLQKLEKPVSGHFSLIWRKIGSNWLVVLDHTS